MAVTCVACLPLLDVRRVGRGNQSAQQPGLGENNTSSIFHKSAPLVRVVMETNASQSRHMRENSFYWLGESKSSEPRRLEGSGLSVPRHAGVLARSKISGSLLHRLSRPWHGLGPRGSHRDRYGAPPKFSSPAAGAY